MIGLDTNVLARYLLDDDPIWSPIATEFVDSQLSPERPGYINTVTLVELVWTLRRVRKYDRVKLAAVLEGLLASDSLVLGQLDEVVRALASFKQGPAGFSDYLLGELNASAGAAPTVTVDRDASKHTNFTRLS